MEKKNRKKEAFKEETITLSRWLIRNTTTDAYRAGRLSGKKRPQKQKIIDMMCSLGGRQALIDQAHELENDPSIGRSGRFKVDWHDTGSRIDYIEYDISIIPDLCRREGVQDAREHQIKLLEQTEQWKSQVADYAWIQPYYEDILWRLNQGKEVKEAEDEDLFKCLNEIVLLKSDIWERKLSSNVFNNSKTFQNKYRSKIVSILNDYSPYNEDNMASHELLAMHGVHSYAQKLELKGSMQYKLLEIVDTSACLYGTVLNAQTLDHAEPVSVSGVKRIMTIENKANYEDMSFQKDTLYIFCHGYFSPKEVSFLKKVCELAEPDCEFLHWGDLDYGGISIYLFNKKHIFPKLVPYKMDVEHFRKALDSGAGIPLEDSVRKKLEKKDAEELQPLKEIILQTGKIIEQEVFL